MIYNSSEVCRDSVPHHLIERRVCWIGHAPSLLEAGALHGGAERLGTLPRSDVDEPEVGVRQNAAMQPRVEVSGLAAEVVVSRLPGRDELLVRTCRDLEGIDQHDSTL